MTKKKTATKKQDAFDIGRIAEIKTESDAKPKKSASQRKLEALQAKKSRDALAEQMNRESEDPSSLDFEDPDAPNENPPIRESDDAPLVDGAGEELRVPEGDAEDDAEQLPDGVVPDNYVPSSEAAEEPSLKKRGRKLAPVADTTTEPAAVLTTVHHKTRYIEHEFTLAEIAEKHENISKLYKIRCAADIEIERLKKELSPIVTQKKTVEDMMFCEWGLIEAGKEFADVACEEVAGTDPRADALTFGAEGMRLIRLDTKECIDWRPYTKQERQGSLFG